MAYVLPVIKKIEQRLSNWSSILSLLLAIILLLPYPLASNTKEAIYAGGLVVITACAVFFHLVATARSGRKALHAEAMPSIREAVRKVITEGMDEFHTIPMRRQSLTAAMEDLAKGFSILTGSGIAGVASSISTYGTVNSTPRHCAGVAASKFRTDHTR